MTKVKDMSPRAGTSSPKALTCEALFSELFFQPYLTTLPPHWPHKVTTANINHPTAPCSKKLN